MLLIVGLGNPGAQYAGNRHNVGFMAVDAIARANGFTGWSRKFSGEIASGTLGTEKALLLKPLTYMNSSGQSVGEAARFHKIEPSQIIVLYDELDLAPGKMRIKTGGGSGGHNGIKSLDAHIGPNYRRLRIGIGHPGHKDLVHNYVLGDFAKADAAWLGPLLQAIGINAALLADGDGSRFLNKIALDTGTAPAKAQASETAASATTNKPKSEPKGVSHIRQARSSAPNIKIPETGPMAAMLKKLFGEKKEN